MGEGTGEGLFAFVTFYAPPYGGGDGGGAACLHYISRPPLSGRDGVGLLAFITFHALPFRGGMGWGCLFLLTFLIQQYISTYSA